MRIVAIGDIHGRNDWKKIVAENNDADKIVFIGDYFDTHENISATVQLFNFKEIIEYKQSNPEKCVLLLGNHDFHYLTPERERYSGFNDFYAVDIREKVGEALRQDLIQMVYVNDKYVFVHAGITKTWCRANNIDLKNLEDSINTLFKQSLKPFYFTVGKNWNDYGDDVTQTPIWVRPLSLSWDAINNYIQVVGHTTQKKLSIDEKIILIDTLGTSGEYLIIDDGIATIKTIENGNSKKQK